MIRWWTSRRASAPRPARAIVLDVETTGLDTRHDHLLAISAVAVAIDWSGPFPRLEMCPGDSLSVPVRPPQVSTRDNVLLHGIGHARQRAAPEPAQALGLFLQWAADAPRLAFHADFDRQMITRHLLEHLGPAPAGEPAREPADQWLDIAHLCRVSFSAVRASSLDDWLAHFGITCMQRHDAAADVLAECELLLRIWPALAREARDWPALRRLAARHRWLPAGV